MKLWPSRWRRARLEEAGPYRWRRILCHRRKALVWIEWDEVASRDKTL